MLRKRVVSTVVAGSAALGAYIISDENRRGKLKSKFNKVKEQIFGKPSNTLEKAGRPEKDHLENTKMVSEGSQFGVQYYNEVKEDEKQQ